MTEWNLINSLCSALCLWVIIVCPNHSCCLSLLRFYPLITSLPHQECCQSVRQISHLNHLLFTVSLSLCFLVGLSAVCVSSSNPKKDSWPLMDACNSNPSFLNTPLMSICSFLVAAAHISKVQIHSPTLSFF